MRNDVMDWNAPSLQWTLPALPADLPHGLVEAPKEVRDHIAALDEFPYAVVARRRASQ
jgi:hypothetical protein